MANNKSIADIIEADRKARSSGKGSNAASVVDALAGAYGQKGTYTEHDVITMDRAAKKAGIRIEENTVVDLLAGLYGSKEKETPAGYYSRPTSGSAGEKLAGTISSLAPTLKEKRTAAETARSVLRDAETSLRTTWEELDAAKAAYGTNPTAEAAEAYNRLETAWNEKYQSYESAFDAFSKAFKDYELHGSAMNGMLSVYLPYSKQEKEKYDNWRGNIRDTQTVQVDIDRINSEIKTLEEKAGRLETLTRFRNDALGVQMKQNLQSVQSELDALRTRRALLQEEQDWSRHFEYADLANASDFADKSQYVSTANGKERSWWDIMLGNYSPEASGWDDPLYEFVNGNAEAGAYISSAAASGHGDNAIGAVFGRTTESKEESQRMTADEVAIFNYLYSTQGKEAAHGYYQYLQSDLNRRQRQADEQYWVDYAARRPALASLFSTLISPAKGMAYLGQAADLMGNGAIDQNAGYNKYSYAGSAIRGQVAKEIEDSGKWGSVGSFAYQTGMSMADFLMNTAITGGSKNLSMAIMGTGAAADATIAAKDRGLSDEQSFKLGGIAGIAELISERVSLEALLNPSLLRNGSLQYIFKNMLAEGSEEVGTDIINLFADILIAKDQSEWQRSIDAYMKNGKSEEEAFGLAMADQAMSMGLDFLGGAISGGIMSGGAAVSFNKNTRLQAHQLDNLDLGMEDIQAFIDTGLESDPDSDAYHIAVEMQQKIEAGEQITGFDLSRMKQANVIAIAEEESETDEPEGLRLRAVDDDIEADEQTGLSERNLGYGEAEAAPEGLRLRAVDDDVNDGAAEGVGMADANLTIAERLHREQMRNGGTEYGENLSDGVQVGYAGQSAGEQAASVDRITGRSRAQTVGGSKTYIKRENIARDLRRKGLITPVSSLELGVSTGTEHKATLVYPKNYWDQELIALEDRIKKETDCRVTFVMDGLQVRGHRRIAKVRGVYFRNDREGDIIVQLNDSRATPRQIADHEAFHAKVDKTSKKLLQDIKEHIVSKYSEAEFDEVLDKYIDELWAIHGVPHNASSEEHDKAVESILEELLADAYAGINAFGAGADRFTEAVNDKMGEYGLGKQTGQDNGTEQPTGPPDAEKYSSDAGGWISLPTLDDDSDTSYDGRSLTEDPEIYSHSFLTAQPDMHAVQLPDVSVVRDSGGKIDTALVVDEGMKNALSVGSERAGRIYVTNRYTGRELWVTAGSIRHGLNGNANRLLTNARLGAVIGDIVQNAIPINALHNKADGVDGTYAMAGYAIDDHGREFVSIVTVEQRTNAVAGIRVYDMTHAISGRQKRSKQVDTKSQGVNPSMLASEISISDLLDAVKSTYRSILSDDVLDTLEETKSTDGYYAGRVRYSYAGQNANTADLEALVRAKEMETQGVADETIRQQTGWHKGMDGLWRWEIGDSGMRYHRGGDAQFSDDHPDYARHQELVQKMIEGTLTVGEDHELRQLDQLWGRERLRLSRRVDGGVATLGDILHHDELFEAYPQLRKTGVRFADLPDGVRGQLNREENVMTLNKSLRNAPEDTLIHEIQHAIQEAEGFAGGASSEFWSDKQVTKPEYEAEIQKARDAVGEVEARFRKEWRDDINLNLAKQYVEMDRQYWAEEAEESVLEGYTRQMDLIEELADESGWRDLLDDYFYANGELQMATMRAGLNLRTSDDLYRNTAGEIEARDVTARRRMDRETRRATRPAGADADTVFAEDADDLSLKLDERYSVDEVDSGSNMLTTDPDIRYSVDDSADQRDDAVQRRARREQQRQKAREKADERRTNVQKRIDAITAAEEKRLQTADKPTRAKQNLRRNLLDQFSIPSGQRGEMGSMINAYAERLIRNGQLTEDDRKHLFDRLYESGVMTEPANDSFAEAREYMKGGRIYVPDRVVHDFGDDWNDIRRRAFAAGVYLTRSQASGGHSIAGIDVWNSDLAASLPGLFNSEETDERTILERIIQVAEEGKEERLSLPAYTARLAGEGYIDLNQYMIEMERRVDWALRAFASEADLEVGLKKQHIKDTAAARKLSIRQRARMAEERDARREMAQRQKDRKELQELQQRTLKQLQWLAKNRHRAPEEQKAVWDEVLGDIDLYAVGAANEMRWSDKYQATWADLVAMYDKAKAEDPNFFELKELEMMTDRLRNKKLADLDFVALNDLYRLAVGLRTAYYNRRNVINDEMHRLFAEIYADSKQEIESAPGGYTGSAADKLLNLDQLTPMNVMERMAGWNPDSAFYSMAKQLEQGERDMRAFSVKVQKMLQGFLTENEDWVKKADGQGKDAIWYEVEVPQLLELGMGDKPIFGPTVKVYMTPAQKVHMYLESKNMDNLRHMTGGRTFVHKELYSKGKRQEAFAQGRTVRLAPETVKKLVSNLTPTEMELARILDQYYNTFAPQEINKVSNILYGYDKAMGKNYAPIFVNDNYTKSEYGVRNETAEGVGNLKGRQYAVNPSYNISAFDAFERNVDQTARFVGMAIPARNWTTLMNWREGNNSTGDIITHKWGNEGKEYIEDLITKLQAGDDAKHDTISSLAQKVQSNYISAIFGANPSIVLKQLGSIPLAGAYLGTQNMPTPAQMFSVDRDLISRYTQELEWRTMGYTTPETKQLKDNPNWTQTNKTIGFIFGGGAITAMDGWAASTLWPWAENKVRREYPDLEIGTREQIEAGESPFYKKVAEAFNDAVSRSQSVSDEIHQGRLRKSKNPITRAFTMFRSDSAQTYNALRQKIGEAQYYMRSGEKGQALNTAKKAVGTAFGALLINAAWGEAINFLMAMWKNKGKHYRDEDEELTAESVTGEMVAGMLGSFSGVVTGGEEVLDIIGNILTGEKIYDIETPGMEQLNDIIETVKEAGGGMRELVAGGWEILQNGGDLGAYLGEHTGQILSNVKELAVAAATYLPGLPVINLEAYLVGALKWISPELGAAYDDLFADVGKGDLTKTEGAALASRIGGILSDRKISSSEDTAAALAALYEAGFKGAVPGDIPASVSVQGEDRKLGVYQQQSYGMIWSSVVSGALDTLVSSGTFQDADEKTREKMLSSLYSYAAEQAKAELFEDYEMDAGAAENESIVDAGASVAECIAWNALTTGKSPDGTAKMKAADKAAELAEWDLPYMAKREIFRTKISDSREETVDNLLDTGLNFDQILRVYSKYSNINGMDIQASQKAVEFSHWVNDQGYKQEQAKAVKDELTYFNMTPASASRYDGMVAAGMDADDAYGLTGVLGELTPDEGAESVTDIQKWRASVDYFSNPEDQLTALSMVMSDSQFAKMTIANDFGVTPDVYITLQEIKPRYDSDKNGAYKQVEIEAAIDSLGGHYSTEQKAVLWQLATGSTSSKNNPYSRSVGQRVLDAKAAAKEKAETETEYEEYTFSQAVMDQLLGRG